jgi:quercetin dioxygenase-like cupin family protein
VAWQLPAAGRLSAVIFELPPGDMNDLDEFVAENLTEFADPSRPGMHVSPSTDFDIVLEGIVGLELDDGEEILRPGDVAVMNGTVHRWHNRGSVVAKIASITVGAHHDAFPAFPQ